MKKLRYCCKNFQNLCNVANEHIPAIRIIKMTSEQFLNVKKIKLWEYEIKVPKHKIRKSAYRFYMTFGYERFAYSCVHLDPIWYCPFCGKRLDKFYNSDNYVHEIEGITFNWKE